MLLTLSLPYYLGSKLKTSKAKVLLSPSLVTFFLMGLICSLDSFCFLVVTSTQSYSTEGLGPALMTSFVPAFYC